MCITKIIAYLYVLKNSLLNVSSRTLMNCLNFYSCILIIWTAPCLAVEKVVKSQLPVLQFP